MEAKIFGDAPKVPHTPKVEPSDPRTPTAKKIATPFTADKPRELANTGSTKGPSPSEYLKFGKRDIADVASGGDVVANLVDPSTPAKKRRMRGKTPAARFLGAVPCPKGKPKPAADPFEALRACGGGGRVDWSAYHGDDRAEVVIEYFSH